MRLLNRGDLMSKFDCSTNLILNNKTQSMIIFLSVNLNRENITLQRLTICNWIRNTILIVMRITVAKKKKKHTIRKMSWLLRRSRTSMSRYMNKMKNKIVPTDGTIPNFKNRGKIHALNTYT